MIASVTSYKVLITSQSFLNDNIITYLFSLCHRESGKEGGRKAGAKEKLWANSKEPLKQPLLRSLQGNPELCHLACDSFTDILPADWSKYESFVAYLI